MLMSIALAASLFVVQAGPGDADASGAVGSPTVEPPSMYRAMVSAAAESAADGVPRDDSTDQVRRMAASDRDDRRYFNRPGATRAEYEREWQQCRQIARRLATARGGGAWMSAGFTHGGLVGGLIFGGLDQSFSERRARRDIRRQCLIARGWRMVEPDEAGRRRIAELSRGERDALFDQMIGAEQIEAGATVTDLASLEADVDAGKAGSDEEE